MKPPFISAIVIAMISACEFTALLLFFYFGYKLFTFLF